MVDSISGYNPYGISGVANYQTDAAAKLEKTLNAASGSKEDEKLMNAAREFESYFLQMLMKEMRNSIPDNGLIPKSTAEGIFESMLDEEYAKNASKGRGMGLAQTIYDQMVRMGGTVIPPNGASVEGAKAADDAAEVENIVDIQADSGSDSLLNL